MKRQYYILFALIFALVSCTQELDLKQETPADCIMLSVSNSPMTKAVAPAGAEYERQLKRLDCFFYEKGQTGASCAYYKKVDLSEVGGAVIPLYVDESIINAIFPSQNTCDVFLIANLPTGTFESGGNGTDVPTLEKTLLSLDGNYDAVDKSFVMWGEGTAEKGNDNNASGEIKLYRAAAKITITVNVPSQIKTTLTEINGDGTTTVTEKIMTPIFEDIDGNSTLKTAFHYGVNKTYLHADYVGNDGKSLLTEKDFFATDKKNYQYVSTTPAAGTTPEKYQYTCEVPFYSYARAWEKGASDAAYLTLELPWKDEGAANYDTYYYQILINGAGRSFEPNHWYDLNVNVGVLGSTVESKPTVIEDLTYYILDWTTEPESETDSGDRYEDVEIQNYTYLIVPEKRIILNNTSTGVIHYDASHKIGIKMNKSNREVEILPDVSTDNSAFYINCGGSTPTVQTLPITEGNFSDDGKGVVTYTYTIPSTPKVYSPIYIYATIWLDFDGDGDIDPDTDEERFVEDVTIVQYPPIYIIPDKSTAYSIFVNNHNREGDNIRFRYGNTNNYYYLGVAPGYSGSGTYMYTINVSSFNENNTFLYNIDNNPNGPQTKYNYIIGDPRQKISDIILNNENYDITSNWATAPDVNGNERKLQYYYPTSEEPGVFQIIAPKFRVVSFHATGHAVINYEGAKMRCASFQEDGFPAGRWRLPTYAEIQFIIMLQREEVIQDIYYGGSKYFSSTNQVQYQDNNVNYMAFENASPGTSGSGSVRCVYDEWYWGSEREAQPNNSFAGGYEFTWGDEKIW